MKPIWDEIVPDHRLELVLCEPGESIVLSLIPFHHPGKRSIQTIFVHKVQTADLLNIPFHNSMFLFQVRYMAVMYCDHCSSNQLYVITNLDTHHLPFKPDIKETFFEMK